MHGGGLLNEQRKGGNRPARARPGPTCILQDVNININFHYNSRFSLLAS